MLKRDINVRPSAYGTDQGCSGHSWLPFTGGQNQSGTPPRGYCLDRCACVPACVSNKRQILLFVDARTHISLQLSLHGCVPTTYALVRVRRGIPVRHVLTAASAVSTNDLESLHANDPGTTDGVQSAEAL